MGIIKKLLDKSPFHGNSAHYDQAFDKLYQKYPAGRDAWGLNLKRARRSLDYIEPLYNHYFKVQIYGKENVDDESYIIVANHTGQIAIDGILISTAFFKEFKTPRVLRSMVERFFMKIPFIGSWAAEGGAVLGDRQNCINLLKNGESILVFPEGVKGIAKNTEEFYQLQKFTHGFYRIAVKSHVKILPIAVVGAEEFFPYVYQAKGLAKFLGLPALPLTPNLFPLPSPVDLYIGEPIQPLDTESEELTDEQVEEEVKKIQNIIDSMIQEGLKRKRKTLDNVKALLPWP